jgi:TolA-binding protein
MIRQIRIAYRAIEPVLLLTLVVFCAAGCTDTSSGGGSPQSNEDFEIRGMIAADRQQMQAMDERLRRMESEIQDLVHNSPQEPVPSEGNAAAAPHENAPPAAPPPAPEAAPGTPPVLGAPPASNAGSPGGEAVPPGAAAVAPGAAPAPGAGASATPGSSTIAPDTGANPPAAEEGTEGGTAEGGNPPAADNGTASDDEGANAGAPSDNGNPPPAPGASASTNEGGAPGNEGAPPANEGDEGNAPPSGGEEVASAPPAATTENAPAAIPPARWPDDLSRELQTTSNFKGGAGKLYQSGLNDMQNHNYSGAVAAFATLQKKFPRSDLGEQASYFSASAFNEMGKYDQAILQYNDVVMRFPNGKYASEALLRESAAFVQINDKVDARLTLQKLINEHAGTPQAAAASQMMKNLESD